MLIDLHLKTSKTPGVDFSAREIALKAKAAGLDGIAICDTLATQHANEIVEACKSVGIAGFVGVEIPTTEGVLLCFAPEINEFYLSEEWRQLTEIVTPAASLVIEMFTNLGGAVIASRPYDMEVAYNMGDLIFTIGGLSGVEVFNMRVTPIQADFAIEAASAMNLPTTGGTAIGGDVTDLGMFATLFPGSFSTQREFVEALKRGDFYAIGIGLRPISNEPRAPREPREERPSRGRSGGGRSGGDRDRGGRSGGRSSGGRR